MRRVDLVGVRFGRLLVLEAAGTTPRRQALWRCVCDCGKETVPTGDKLRRGTTQSCGCLRNEVTSTRLKKHGCTDTPLYGIWCGMLARCYSRTHHAYRLYGARGITVCERWHTFANFMADMGSRPSPNHSIDRINSRGNYEPGNCRWATRAEQATNTSRVRRFLLLDGSSLCCSEVARYLAMPAGSFWRLYFGVGRAL